MNDRKTWKLVLVLVLIAFFSYAAIFGIGPAGARVIKGASDMRTGIDIRGGISAVLVPEYPEGTTGRNIADDLVSARTIIEARLDARGIFDKNINIDTTNNRIIIEIPWAADETNFDAQQTMAELGSTAYLTFRTVDATQVDENGDYLPVGDIVIDGADVADASSYMDQTTNYYSVELKLNADGQKKFSAATASMIGQPLAIYMDDLMLSAPTVKTAITGDSCSITGTFTSDEAKKLADSIKSGALPAKLVAQKVDSVSPTLGQGALEVALKAGYFAFALVCLFMIFVYRLPGIIASLCVSALVAITVLLMANLGLSITLPGIGGIILSVGMGVDANVVIYERIREEMRAGKTTKAAIESGFKRAFIAVLDSNVTTLISASVLYVMGSGPIRGFGVTLGIGVLVSFITAVSATHILLRETATFKFARNKWMYRVAEVKSADAKANA